MIWVELKDFVRRAWVAAALNYDERGDSAEKIVDAFELWWAATPELAAAAELVPLAELEHHYVRVVLAACGGNKSRAAQILGVNRRTVYRKLERVTP